jgi:hypothetical protein
MSNSLGGIEFYMPTLKIVDFDVREIPYPSAVATVFLVGSLIHSLSVLADTCVQPSFAAVRTFQVESRPSSLVANDYDGDGRLDLAVAGWSGNASVSPGRRVGDMAHGQGTTR